jgi:hypothetical protein
MPDGAALDIRTLRTHFLHAESEIIELNRQIAERERFSIPTIGLEEALSEVVAARDTLRARLKQAGEDI